MHLQRRRRSQAVVVETGERARHSTGRAAYSGAACAACACILLTGCVAEPGDQVEVVKSYPRVAIGGIEVQAPADKLKVPTMRLIKAPVLLPKPLPPAFNVVTVRTSGYCPCARCCGRMTGRTSTRSNAWVSGVAADPTWLPYGTVVIVPGYGEATIDDTGGDMKRRKWNGTPRLDVRFTYHWEAREWGIKYLDVKVFNKEP